MTMRSARPAAGRTRREFVGDTEGRRIGGLHLDQVAGQQSRDNARASEANRKAGEGGSDRLPDRDADDVARAGTEGDADGDLTLPQADRVGDQAADSDEREKNCAGREGHEDGEPETLGLELVPSHVEHGGRPDVQVLLDTGKRSSHDERGPVVSRSETKHDDRAGFPGAALKAGLMELMVRIRPEAHQPEGWNDADDRPHHRSTPPQSLPNRVLAWPERSGQKVVDDHDPLGPLDI
jgi:hypothetical protein